MAVFATTNRNDAVVVRPIIGTVVVQDLQKFSSTYIPVDHLATFIRPTS